MAIIGRMSQMQYLWLRYTYFSISFSNCWWTNWPSLDVVHFHYFHCSRLSKQTRTQKIQLSSHFLVYHLVKSSGFIPSPGKLQLLLRLNSLAVQNKVRFNYLLEQLSLNFSCYWMRYYQYIVHLNCIPPFREDYMCSLSNGTIEYPWQP